ncbi:MAG: extracellular solute-binding protein [Clostridia bacterium]|nr:extracellular solute-binding protein [Clostridia bacterium]
MKRIIALLLAALMVFALVGCNGDKEEAEGGHTYKPMEGEVPVDLGGYEFTVVDFNNSHWNKEPGDRTPYLDAWQQALDEVEYLYNCTITASYVGPSELFNAVQPEVAAGGKYADLVCTTQWAYGYLMGANLMLDLNQLEVNWDNPWWNQNIRRISTIQGKTYAGNGSFIFDAAATYLVYYNREIWEELQLPDAEKLVREGKWTFDLMRQYCQAAQQDWDSSGTVDSVDDRWGMVTPNGDFARALFMGLGGQYFATDPATGKVKLACDNERTYQIVEKMYEFAQKDRTVCTLQFEGWPELASVFTKGNALFLSTGCQVAELKDMEADWGVLPMPKFDESQESYRSCVDHNSTVFGVTSSNTTLHETGVILEALGRHCQTLEDIYWPDYEETYWRSPTDSQLIAEFVVGSGQYDLAILMQNTNNVFPAPMSRVFSCMFGAGGSDFSSYMDSVRDVINLKIDEVFAYA